MHIICKQEILTHNINLVLKAVTGKSTSPILDNILLISDENGFRLVGNDLQLGIETVNIDANVIKPGIIALDAKMFSEIIRKLPKNDVEIQVTEKNITIIKCGKSKFEILGVSGEDFPRLPNIEKIKSFKVNCNKLRNMIKKTNFSVAITESKPVLTGELFEISTNNFNIVAVDGHRIAFINNNIESELNLNVVIPAKTLLEISKIMPTDNDAEIQLFFTDKHVLFQTFECIVVSTLLEGDFIKYNQIFTEDYKSKINLDRLSLISALERSMLLSKESQRTPVKLDIKEDLLIITSNSEIGNCYEEVSTMIEGDLLEIAFNPKYLLDALKSIETEKIEMFFTTSLSPCIIKGENENNQKYLILPLRLK